MMWQSLWFGLVFDLIFPRPKVSKVEEAEGKPPLQSIANHARP
jgi:hypothetical protein